MCLYRPLQFYSLWKDPGGLNVMGDSGDSTLASRGTISDTKDTIVQLNQEVLKLRQELSMVMEVQRNLRIMDMLRDPALSFVERSSSFGGYFFVQSQSVYTTAVLDCPLP